MNTIFKISFIILLFNISNKPIQNVRKSKVRIMGKVIISKEQEKAVPYCSFELYTINGIED